MAKVKATNSAYRIFEDIIVLAGGIARLGKNIAAQKIQSSADAASNFVNENVDMDNINDKLSGAKDSLVQASDYAMKTDVSQMAEDAAAFARKNPITTLVSVVAVGTLVSYMLRSHDEEPAPRSNTRRSKPASRRAKSSRGKSSQTKSSSPKRSNAAVASKASSKSRAKSANGLARDHA